MCITYSDRVETLFFLLVYVYGTTFPNGEVVGDLETINRADYRPSSVTVAYGSRS